MKEENKIELTLNEVQQIVSLLTSDDRYKKIVDILKMFQIKNDALIKKQEKKK